MFIRVIEKRLCQKKNEVTSLFGGGFRVTDQFILRDHLISNLNLITQLFRGQRYMRPDTYLKKSQSGLLQTSNSNTAKAEEPKGVSQRK